MHVKPAMEYFLFHLNLINMEWKIDQEGTENTYFNFPFHVF